MLLVGKEEYLIESLLDRGDTARVFAGDDIPKKLVNIIGGGHIYEEFLPYCKVAHVTKIDHAYQADTFFPNLDETGEWEITADSDEQTYFDLEYAFLKYERKGEAKPRIRK